MEETFPNLRKSIKVQDKYKTPNRKAHERNTQHHKSQSLNTKDIGSYKKERSRHKQRKEHESNSKVFFMEIMKTRRNCVNVVQTM